jgi:hypothetical protein
MTSRARLGQDDQALGEQAVAEPAAAVGGVGADPPQHASTVYRAADGGLGNCGAVRLAHAQVPAGESAHSLTSATG